MPAQVWKVVIHVVIVGVPSVTLRNDQRGPPELQTSPPPLPALRRCLRLWLNLLPIPQASRHITLGFYYFPAPQHTESHVKAPTSLPCPSCPCVQSSYYHSSLPSCPITPPCSRRLCALLLSFSNPSHPTPIPPLWLKFPACQPHSPPLSSLEHGLAVDED